MGRSSRNPSSGSGEETIRANLAMNWVSSGVNVCGQALFLVASIMFARKGVTKA